MTLSIATLRIKCHMLNVVMLVVVGPDKRLTQIFLSLLLIWKKFYSIGQKQSSILISPPPSWNLMTRFQLDKILISNSNFKLGFWNQMFLLNFWGTDYREAIYKDFFRLSLLTLYRVSLTVLRLSRFLIFRWNSSWQKGWLKLLM